MRPQQSLRSAPKPNSFRSIDFEVANTKVWESSLSQYKIFGSQTPSAFTDKRQLVPELDIASVGAVFIDVLRATTTLVAVGAAGSKGIFVDVKPKDGPYPFEPPAHLADRTPWVYGGEFNGSAVTGVASDGQPVVGVIGNSPIDALPDVFADRYMRFFSTNGSTILQAVVDGGMPTVCAMTIANIEATVDYVLSTGADRFWFTCGGFYGAATIEDSVAAGIAIDLLIERGFATENDLDDEAQSMLVLGRYFSGSRGVLGDLLVDKLTRSQVGLLLIDVGRAADIAAAVTGEGIDSRVRTAMANTVMRVESDQGPMLVPVDSGTWR